MTEVSEASQIDTVGSSLKTGATVNAYGLAFSISPAKHKPKSKNDEDDEVYILTLAPFTKAPKINFGQVKVNQQVERNLLIINPQQFEVKLNISNQDLKINNMEITIDKNTNLDFKIKWQPDKPDNYKYSILFEVTNVARLKFLVHAFGVCYTDNKKQTRKPLTMLQPLREKKAPAIGLKPIGSSVSGQQQTKDKSVEVKIVTNKENVLKKAQMQPNVCKPSIQIDKTFTTSSSLNTTTTKTRTTLLLGPPQPSAARIAEKKRQAWSSKFYRIDDDDVNHENLDETIDQKTVFEQTNHMLVSDIRRQTTIISSPKLVKKGGYEYFYSSSDNLSENHNHLNPSTPYLTKSLSSSNLSFIDKTVVFVAGTHGNNVEDEDAYRINSTVIHNHQNHNDITNIDMRMATSSTSDNLAAIANHHDSPTISSTVKKSNFNFNTPKYSYQPSTTSNVKNTSVTPKLSDFMKTESNETTTSSTYYHKPDLESTKIIVSTGLIDIETIDATHCDFEPTQQKIDQLSRFSADLIEKYTILCQKHWRMKQFRRKLRELRIQKSQELIHSIIESQRDLALDLKLAEHEQEEIIRIEKEKNELNMKLLEQARLERELLFHKCLIRCQRIWRMKQFRKKLNELRHKLEKERNEKINKSVRMVQMKWNYIKFRKNLQKLKEKKAEYDANLLKYAILCQRIRRMKLFRENLKKLLEEREKMLKYVIMCQRLYRYKKFRSCVLKLKQEKYQQMNLSASLIQKSYRMYKFRRQMKLYRQSAYKIQSWFRNDMKERRQYLLMRSSTIKIQKWYKSKYELKVKSAIKIQSTIRMYLCKKHYQLEKNSALKIQKWFKSIRIDRIRYLKLKRTLPLIQKKSIKYVQKLNQSAMKIQKWYRMCKFRQCMRKYRQSAICIQRWHRQMFLRYEFLKKKTIIFRIQLLYRNIYLVNLNFKRNSAAFKIQSAWRGYLARKELAKLKKEHEIRMAHEREQIYMNKCATKIQALWRGYLTRKENNLNFDRIRNRLSFYMQNRNSSEYQSTTLGGRILNSLKIVKFPSVPIQQLVVALSDLDKVTKLSPECCEIFSKEGAIDILYTFIFNCNRSVPHMDLIKMCLQILINLAKYVQTCVRILEPQHSLSILLNLLQAYQSSNSNIFMSVCCLFILLAQDESIKVFLLEQKVFIRKLLQIYAVLERKANLRPQQVAQITPQPAQLNSTIIISTNNTNNNNVNTTKSSNILMFNIAPEWCLNKKFKHIELIDPVGALEHLLDVLEINSNYQQQSNEPIGKTTRLMSQKEKVSSIKKSQSTDDQMSASKTKNQLKTISSLTSMTSLCSSASSSINGKNTVQSKNTSQNLKNRAAQRLKLDHLPTNFSQSADSAVDDHFHYQNEDDHLSICSNESYRSTTSNTTIKSLASFHNDRPKMNSTSIMASSSSSSTFKVSYLKTSSSNKIVKKKQVIKRNSFY